MPFDRPSITTIKDRIEKGIEARLFGKVALLRNAILRILARVFAGAIHGCYGYIQYVSTRILFVTTAEGTYLDNPHGRMWNVTRRPGSFAIGTAIFTGVNGTVIPVDTRVQNEDGVEYGTTIIGTITAGQASIAIQAVESGDDGNYVRPNPPDPIYLQMVSPISGVDDEVEVDGDITGGTDREDDETYRARILQRIQTVPTGGSAADYERWATSFSGVARAWVYPLASGPGTVSVCFTVSGDDPVPTPAKISDLQAYMDDLRPVTADLTVVGITDTLGALGKALIGFNIDLPASQNTADYQETIKDNLKALFLPHKPGTTLPISQIRAAISNSGVDDYDITIIFLDGSPYPVDDVPLDGYEYPWLGTVNFGVL